MKLNSVILASIDKVIDALHPRVAYATVIDFTYVSECRDCNNSCQGACDGTCEGMCTVACVGVCDGTCEGSCIDNVQNTLASKLQ